MKLGLKMKLLFEYMSQRVHFSAVVAAQKYNLRPIADKDVWGLWATSMKNTFTTQMTFFYRNKGLEMEPIVSSHDTLVVRKLPYLSARLPQPLQEINEAYVGDVVVLRDPENSKNYIVRRLVAVEGYEMVSTNKDDEPFVIEQGQGWVLSGNPSLTPKESKDSRTYGPISMSDIVGRVIYRFRSLEDEGLMVNNKLSMNYDMPVLYIEMDTKELQRIADKENKKTKSS